jgi:hypothetical protein
MSMDTKKPIDAGTGWPSDCKNLQEVIDKYKPKGMGNLEFSHEGVQATPPPVEDIQVGSHAPKEHKPKEATSIIEDVVDTGKSRPERKQL